MTDITLIETERLIMRQWRAEDAEHIISFYADPQISRFVGGPRTRDEAWRGMALLVGHWQLKGFGYWAIEQKSDGAFVGCIGLWQSPGWPELELGYWLMPQFHGCGMAREVCEQAVRVARDDLNAPSLVSYIDAENIPSIKLAESLGARYEKTIELDTHGSHGVYRHFGTNDA